MMKQDTLFPFLSNRRHDMDISNECEERT